MQTTSAAVAVVDIDDEGSLVATIRPTDRPQRLAEDRIVWLSGDLDGRSAIPLKRCARRTGTESESQPSPVIARRVGRASSNHVMLMETSASSGRLAGAATANAVEGARTDCDGVGIATRS